jgi:hypothetical protein
MFVQWVEFTPEEESALDEAHQRLMAEDRAARAQAEAAQAQEQQQEWHPPAHLAHVLVAEEEPALRTIWAAICASEGHRVTAPDTFWGVMAVLRTTLHPLVVVYGRDGYLPHQTIHEDRVRAFEALAVDMRQHLYVAMDWRPGEPLPPRLRAIEEALDVEFLHPQPMDDPEALVAAVNRAAERIAERSAQPA